MYDLARERPIPTVYLWVNQTKNIEFAYETQIEYTKFRLFAPQNQTKLHLNDSSMFV